MLPNLPVHPPYPTPPTITPIQPTPDRGEAARNYLDSVGLVSRVPPIRSSDFRYLNKPFRYYLERRLGISRAFSSSDALSHGTWFHVRANAEGDAEAVKLVMGKAFKLWTVEATLAAKALNISGTALYSIVEKERVRMQEAASWYEAARKVRHRDLPCGIDTLSNPKEWRVLATELLINAQYAPVKAPRLVAQFDRLMYHIPTDLIWIDDWKTTDGSCRFRSKTCEIELQTRHYLTVAREALGQIKKKFSLPPTTQLGGIRHLIVRKPAIRLSSKDRLFYYESEGKRSGISGTARQWGEKGWAVWLRDSTHTDPHSNGTLFADGLHPDRAKHLLHQKTGKEPEKMYFGEPSITLHQNRVDDWYLARGDYEANKVEFDTDPPVLESRTNAELLNNRDLVREYIEMVQQIARWARDTPWPVNYPRTDAGMSSDYSPSPSPFADFHLLPVASWPQLMRENHLLVRHRDTETWLVEDEGSL